MMNNVQEALNIFNPISLSEMDSVKLLNRVDSKYVLHKNQFTSVLPLLNKEYKSLEIKNRRTARYKSLYFDTCSYDFFNDHHNGRVSRYKVRTRKYLDSDLCFFEIKHKLKGRTHKTRIKIQDFEEELQNESLDHLNRTIPSQPKIKTSIWNSFERITLVSNDMKERMTIDLGLNFEWKGNTFGYDDIIIIEVKQESDDRDSPCRQILKKHHIRQARISKYCIGMGMLYPSLKINNFKKKYLLIDKIRKQHA